MEELVVRWVPMVDGGVVIMEWDNMIFCENSACTATYSKHPSGRENMDVFRLNGFDFCDDENGHLRLASVPFR